MKSHLTPEDIQVKTCKFLPLAWKIHSKQCPECREFGKWGCKSKEVPGLSLRGRKYRFFKARLDGAPGLGVPADGKGVGTRLSLRAFLVDS